MADVKDPSSAEPDETIYNYPEKAKIDVSRHFGFRKEMVANLICPKQFSSFSIKRMLIIVSLL